MCLSGHWLMCSTIGTSFPFHMKSVKGEEGELCFLGSLASPIAFYSPQDCFSEAFRWERINTNVAAVLDCSFLPQTTQKLPIELLCTPHNYPGVLDWPVLWHMYTVLNASETLNLNMYFRGLSRQLFTQSSTLREDYWSMLRSVCLKNPFCIWNILDQHIKFQLLWVSLCMCLMLNT